MNFFSRIMKRDLPGIIHKYKEKIPLILGLIFLMGVYTFSKSSGENKKTIIYKAPSSLSFKNAKIIGSQFGSIYKGKEKLLSKTVRSISKTQKALQESFLNLENKLDSLQRQKNIQSEKDPVKEAVSSNDNSNSGGNVPQQQVRFYPSPGNFKIATNQAINQIGNTLGKYNQPKGQRSRIRKKIGPSIISFPVKGEESIRVAQIVLPTGSFVKAKMLTGVDAPEGKTYPVLLQLDYAYMIPNHKQLDLSGCFIIAKAQGNLSTERVNMQADKLSCVSKTGEMFERKVNGYIADSVDNDFAAMGEVKSKQERVAGIAFLSSIIEGISKAVQFAETTQTTNSMGGGKSIVTGDKAKYLAAGGASNAASVVTQWYLKQANNLLPTIKVGSGKDVWVVMQSSVNLPKTYFKSKSTRSKNESLYKYLDGFTR